MSQLEALLSIHAQKLKRLKALTKEARTLREELWNLTQGIWVQRRLTSQQQDTHK